MIQVSTSAQEDYLEEQVGLKDYEVDRLKARGQAYFHGRDGKADVQHAKRGMDRILIGFSIICDVFLVGLCYLMSGALAFIFFAIILQLMVIYWRVVMSPLRFHTFASDEQYLQYRGYLTQAQQLKAHWQDGKYKFFVLLYWIADAIVICCIIDAPNQLAYVNNVIYDRGEFPLSTVTSLVPALVVIGLVVNVIGAVVYSKYKKIDRARGLEVEDAKMQQALLGVIIGSVFALFLIGSMNATAFTVFWQPAPGINNPIYLFDMEQPLLAARWNIFWYYGFVIGGSAFLGMLILMGFNGMENAFLHVRLNRAWETSAPVEKNWEFKAVVARHASDLIKKNQASKRSLWEIIYYCVALLLAFWVFLWWGNGGVGDIKFGASTIIAGVLILSVLLGWLFISHRRHVKRDGRYFYPPPTKNTRYAAFDERGLGSWKYYYREVLPKKKGLLRSATYWALIIAAIFNFKDAGLRFINWKDLFEGSTTPRGYLIDLGEALGVGGNEILVAIIVTVTVLTVVTFIGALGKSPKNFKGSVFWCYFYKILLGVMVVLCFFWATKLPGIVMAVNLLSVDFAIAVGLIVAYFLLIALLSRYLLFPLLIKFDNLHLARNKILEIVIMQVVLMSVLNLIFQWLLPMTDVNGQLIVYGYPWRTGVGQEGEALMENFDLGVFLMEWGGRYIIWGAVQQWIVMAVFLELWRKAFPKSKGYVISVGTALIFGVIHAIDWPLILFTFIAGFIWAWNWNKEFYDKETGRVCRGNNLFLWGLVHGMGGSLLGILMPFGAAVGPFNM